MKTFWIVMAISAGIAATGLVFSFNGVYIAHNKLSRVQVFSMGYVGFFPQRSEGGLLYRYISDSYYADFFFSKLLRSSESTLAAKMYAACGLLDSSPSDLEQLSSMLRGRDLEVAVMRNDIMNMENVDELLTNIRRFGCLD